MWIADQSSNGNTRLPILPRWLLVTAMVLSLAPEALAQPRARRVTTRTADGYTWSGWRTTGATSRAVSGDTSSRATTVQRRWGKTVTGARQVTRDEDKVIVDRQAQSSTGASLSKHKEYEIDDGRVESVDRTSTRTDRYGRTAQWRGEAEREGYGWDVDGEGRTRFGREVEVDGFARRPYFWYW